MACCCWDAVDKEGTVLELRRRNFAMGRGNGDHLVEC